MPGHALERDDLLLLGAGEVLAGLVELALALEELAIALLEHVRCAGRAARRVRAGVAPGAASSFALGARLVLGLAPRRSFSSFASRMSSFWRARASASMRRASACAAFIACDAHIAADEHAEYGSADGGHEGHRHDDRCVHLFLPSGPDHAAGRVNVATTRSRDEEEERSTAWGGGLVRAAMTTVRPPRWAAIGPVRRSERR